ncbi:MAG: hypothetical protein HY820_26820 [Acidobacteria bacterium]|nr:hypothetical protein [Acidobacteriota bacterium]
MKTNYPRARWAVAALAAVGFASLSFGQNPPAAPCGKYLVYSAAGVFNPNVPPVEGDLAAWFHGTIMGRTPFEIQQ